MTDVILSVIALAGFAAFMFILGYWVQEPDLIAFLSLGVAMAAFDFWRAWRMDGRNGK